MLDKSYYDGTRLKAYLALLASMKPVVSNEDKEEVKTAPLIVLPSSNERPVENVVSFVEVKQQDIEPIVECVVPDGSLFVESNVVKDRYDNMQYCTLPRLTRVRNSQWSKELNTHRIAFCQWKDYRNKVKKGMVNTRAAYDFEKKEVFNYVKEVTGGKVRFAEYRHMIETDYQNEWDNWYVAARRLELRHMMVSFKGLTYLWTARNDVKVVEDVSFKDDFIVDAQVASNEIVITDVLKVNEYDVMTWTFVRRLGILKELCGIIKLSWIVPLECVKMRGTILSNIASPYGVVFVNGDSVYQYGYSEHLFVLGEKFVNFMVLTVKDGYSLRVMRPNNKNQLHLAPYSYSKERLVYECGQVCLFRKIGEFWQYVKRSSTDVPDQEFRAREVDRALSKDLSEIQLVLDKYFKLPQEKLS